MNKSRKFTALFVTYLLCIILPFTVSAQVDDSPEDGMYIERPKVFSVGGVIGANFAQIDGDNYAGYHKIGLNVGGIGYARVYKHLALSFELLYSQKGAKSNIYRVSVTDSLTLVSKYNVTLNYVEIPLMINYFDKHKSHFSAGFSYSRLISSIETVSSDPALTIDFNKYPFRNAAYDVVGAASMHLYKGLFLNIRFQYGISPLRVNSPPELARTQRQFNNIWTVRLMYLFM